MNIFIHSLNKYDVSLSKYIFNEWYWNNSEIIINFEVTFWRNEIYYNVIFYFYEIFLVFK